MYCSFLRIPCQKKHVFPVMVYGMCNALPDQAPRHILILRPGLSFALDQGCSAAVSPPLLGVARAHNPKWGLVVKSTEQLLNDLKTLHKGIGESTLSPQEVWVRAWRESSQHLQRCIIYRLVYWFTWRYRQVKDQILPRTVLRRAWFLTQDVICCVIYIYCTHAFTCFVQSQACRMLQLLGSATSKVKVQAHFYRRRTDCHRAEQL